ncbi:MAG TPA: cobalt-precorrin-5B (C(1))-methyltransferase, partial [Nitrososphaera sp.]
MVGKEGDEQFYNDLKLAEQEQVLPPEVEEKKRKGSLRSGYTTGTTATAATKAALYALISGKPVEEVTVQLPKGGAATLKIAWTRMNGHAVTSAAIKDGGDDPDATHGAEICSTVSYSKDIGQIRIEGGRGVGRVTKPGLGLEIGQAAINPTPKNMLQEAVV